MAKVQLLNYTHNADRTVAICANTCYSKKGFTEKEEKFNDNDKLKKLLDKLYISGHTSTFEHINFTFGIEDISRVASHQLVRHRLASYSQQSLRYTKADTDSFYYPEDIIKNKWAKNVYCDAMGFLEDAYERLLDLGIKKEDARYLLPNSTQSQITFTMNARTLFNFFEERLCLRAQKEIRDIANDMLKLVKQAAPITFGRNFMKCGRCDNYECKNNPERG